MVEILDASIKIHSVQDGTRKADSRDRGLAENLKVKVEM